MNEKGYERLKANLKGLHSVGWRLFREEGVWEPFSSHVIRRIADSFPTEGLCPVSITYNIIKPADDDRVVIEINRDGYLSLPV